MLARSKVLLEANCMKAKEARVACEAVLCEATSSRVATVMVNEAAHRDCSLIVMGTHGRNGRTQLVLGSDAERVVHASLVPVLLVSQDWN